MTTQQSGFIGPGGAESSQVLVKFLVKAAFRGELLFRPSRPDSIETAQIKDKVNELVGALFRPSRPDSIETIRGRAAWCGHADCSGHLGRTPLRLGVHDQAIQSLSDCSGHLGRTPLRHH